MVSDIFYKRYKLFLSSNPIFPRYIRWVYNKNIEDFKALNLQPSFYKGNAHVLLCGTCGEITSNLFVKYVDSVNPKAKITILDYGEAQIRHSRKLLEQNYSNKDIHYIVSDARESGIPDASVDYIDTDFMFEYLHEEGLDALFAEWKRILKPDGTITFRAMATKSWFSRLNFTLVVHLFCKYILKSDVYDHSMNTIQTLLRKNNFDFTITGKALCFFGYRFLCTPK